MEIPKFASRTEALTWVVLETIKDMGSLGAPSGIIYSVLMAIGVELYEYQAILDTLVSEGKIKNSKHLLTYIGA